MEAIRDFLLTVRLATESGLSEDPETAESAAWQIVALADEFRSDRTQRNIYEE